MDIYIIIILLLIIIIIYILTKKRKINNIKEKFYESEKNYVNNIEKNEEIKIMEQNNINMGRNDIKCIIQYIDNNTTRLIFLNFTNEKIMLDMNFDNIKKKLEIQPFYTNIIIKDNSFNFVPKINIKTSIPKTIMQTAKSRYVTNNKYLSIRSIIDNNPNYDYEFFDNNESKKFIEKYFDKDVVDAYDNLIPGAYKADLFRYCYLYIKGGIYVDCKMVCHINFDDLFNNDYDMILVKDRIPNAYWNGFICSKPKLNIFKECINKIVENVKNKNYGIDPLDITGPRLFYNIGEKYLNRLKIKILYLTNMNYQDSNNYVYYGNDIKVLNVMYPNYYHENNYITSNHYSKLWQEKKVYKND
jgi:mannosyltransferase OCH1-like enzyme